jgi:hypothetical protein
MLSSNDRCTRIAVRCRDGEMKTEMIGHKSVSVAMTYESDGLGHLDLLEDATGDVRFE